MVLAVKGEVITEDEKNSTMTTIMIKPHKCVCHNGQDHHWIQITLLS